MDEKELINYIKEKCDSLDAIVVEGYDGVGKGRVLNILSKALGVTPYRPDYNLWQKYDHRVTDRWKISGFFWDVYSHFRTNHPFSTDLVMLFDRGVLSGAVYNGDDSIAEDYKTIIRDQSILHILVSCTKEDYEKFARSRISEDKFDPSVVNYLWEKSQEYRYKYLRAFDIAGVDYILYCNRFNESISENLSHTCEGCGHYNYGYCRHPLIDEEVEASSERCELSSDREVQDREVSENDTEMHCV